MRDLSNFRDTPPRFPVKIYDLARAQPASTIRDFRRPSPRFMAHFIARDTMYTFV